MADLAVQNMSLADLQATLRWAEDEGWNPGIADAEAFLAADPQGFFLTRRKGDPVAAISVVNHNAKNAFLGLYICHPEWRGLGFGLSTWEHALKHAGERTVGLDGVP
ncbi:MAG: GNAT family N-acetyltransferase, partial [Cyanobacteria bacterium P01_C01_bin.147]